MAYAIIRMQKIKHVSKIRHSFEHAFREQETPNANPDQLEANTHMGAQSVNEALDKFNQAMPEKVRKNAVLALEFMVSATPEVMNAKSRNEQDAYLSDALLWLQDKHGAENVIYAGVHRDENTCPHLYAYVVPKDDRGKLNCRAFYGEKTAFSKMQTDFAEKVGKKHGLERGVEGSRARHEKVRDFYARVSEKTPQTPPVKIPEPKIFEGKEMYGRRVAESVLEQIKPEWLALKAKASEMDNAKQKEKNLRKTMTTIQRSMQPIMKAFEPLNHAEKATMLAVIMETSKELIEKRAVERKKLFPEKRGEQENTKKKGRELER